MTLTLKLAHQSFCMTLRLMMMHHIPSLVTENSMVQRISADLEVSIQSFYLTKSGHTETRKDGYSDSKIPTSLQWKYSLTLWTFAVTLKRRNGKAVVNWRGLSVKSRTRWLKKNARFEFYLCRQFQTWKSASIARDKSRATYFIERVRAGSYVSHTENGKEKVVQKIYEYNVVQWTGKVKLRKENFFLKHARKYSDLLQASKEEPFKALGSPTAERALIYMSAVLHCEVRFRRT